MFTYALNVAKGDCQYHIKSQRYLYTYIVCAIKATDPSQTVFPSFFAHKSIFARSDSSRCQYRFQIRVVHILLERGAPVTSALTRRRVRIVQA
jgi:hypothetical protein